MWPLFILASLLKLASIYSLPFFCWVSYLLGNNLGVFFMRDTYGKIFLPIYHVVILLVYGILYLWFRVLVSFVLWSFSLLYDQISSLFFNGCCVSSLCLTSPSSKSVQVFWYFSNILRVIYMWILNIQSAEKGSNFISDGCFSNCRTRITCHWVVVGGDGAPLLKCHPMYVNLHLLLINCLNFFF